MSATPDVAASRHLAIPYGSDPSGLVCGFAFDREGPTRGLDSASAEAWLETHVDADGQRFAWLHFSLSNVQTEKWLRERIELPVSFYQTLREGPGSTRIEQSDDCLIAVINDVVFDFSFDESQISTLWMCVCDNLVVSARVHPLRSVDRLQASVKAGERLASPVALLAHFLRDQAEVLQQIARKAGREVDGIEDRLLAGRIDATMSALGALRRVFVRLRRLLAPEPGSVFRLLNRPPSWFGSADVNDLRAATEEFSVVLNDIAALQERTKLLQEEIGAHTTERTNRSIFLLTMVTALALPINIIAGLLGMNVGGIPLAEDPRGFWLIAAIIAGFAVFAGWYAFSRQRD